MFLYLLSIARYSYNEEQYECNLHNLLLLFFVLVRNNVSFVIYCMVVLFPISIFFVSLPKSAGNTA
jgi:hypothetical protein